MSRETYFTRKTTHFVRKAADNISKEKGYEKVTRVVQQKERSSPWSMKDYIPHPRE